MITYETKINMNGNAESKVIFSEEYCSITDSCMDKVGISFDELDNLISAYNRYKKMMEVTRDLH